jgi:hypothetical protein
MFIKLNKIQSKLLAWVQRAIDPDEDREPLTGAYVSDSIVGSDGVRLIAVKTESVLEDWDLVFNDQVVRFGKIKAGENILEPQVLEHATFPDYMENVLPTGDPTFVTAFNPKFMIDFCRGLDKDEAVRIVFYGRLSPFELHGTMEGEPVYGLIMPMDSEHADIAARTWRPGR